MTISPTLNLVLPLYRENGDLYANIHSQPIGVTAYNAHFRLLIRTYQMMIDDGASAFSAAVNYLKMAAQGMVVAGDSAEAVYAPLLAEIERLSFAIVATKTGWDTIPLQQAIAGKMLEPGDDIEVMNASVFFTVASHVPPKARRSATLEFGMNRFGARTSSLSLTDCLNSLPTSTAPVISDVMVANAPAQGVSQQGQTVSLTV